MADWQLYMHVKPEEVQKIFLQRWPSAGLKKTEALAFRGRIARELLELEPDDYRTELKADCVQRHREDLKAHALKELPRALRDDEQRMLYVLLCVSFVPQLTILQRSSRARVGSATTPGDYRRVHRVQVHPHCWCGTCRRRTGIPGENVSPPASLRLRFVLTKLSLQHECWAD